MFEDLTNKEKAIMEMLIQGAKSSTIIEWFFIDYKSYNSIRKSILKKLGIKRITQLLKIVIENGYFSAI